MPADTKKISTPGRSRSDTLNMRIDPMLKYLAEITARETQRTLSGFIEWAIKRSLTVEVMREDEPKVTEPHGPIKATPLYNEGFWDVDEADRFFKLASFRQNLLTIPEQRLWKLFTMHMNHAKRESTIEAFREFWNNPSINTSHLNEGGE